jgi:hypothetical protein
MIPPYDASGNLPTGVHRATWAEVEAHFGTTARRRRLLGGLLEALKDLRYAGCRRVYLDGSFVTEKPDPDDYDACYETVGVDPGLLDPVLLDFRARRAAQKAKYLGELFPSSYPAATGYNFFQFFQHDKNTGAPKGIVAINLGSLP